MAIGSAGWIRTIDIRVMGPAFCRLNYRAVIDPPAAHRASAQTRHGVSGSGLAKPEIENPPGFRRGGFKMQFSQDRRNIQTEINLSTHRCRRDPPIIELFDQQRQRWLRFLEQLQVSLQAAPEQLRHAAPV